MKFLGIFILVTLIEIVKGTWVAAVQPVLLSIGALFSGIDLDVIDIQSIKLKSLLPFHNKLDSSEDENKQDSNEDDNKQNSSEDVKQDSKKETMFDIHGNIVEDDDDTDGDFGLVDQGEIPEKG